MPAIFPASHPEGNKNGHWFDCDRYEPAVKAAQQLLGFTHADEFIFTAAGLSENLARLLDTFFRPGKKDWQSGKTKILMLATDFFSDQAVVASVMKRAINTAQRFELFPANRAPDVASQVIKVNPDENGIYQTDAIIAAIKNNADKIQVICLSDIVFNTGQRLQLHKILAAVKQDIEKNHIIVGLDLAHTVGNRAINLAGFPVRIDFAVGCGYKHLSGFAGSSFGIYVNKDVDLNKYPPLQGWKAADPTKVFATIHKYDDSIMTRSGAAAFRISNPPPVALIPAQEFLTYFGDIGFDKCFNKSECLTRYLIAQLQARLGDQIEFVTPLDPAQRGAMVVFRVKELRDVQVVEESLKSGGLAYEIDARPPNNIRLTAHYGYTKFEQVSNLVQKLKLVITAALSLHESVPVISH